MRPVLGTETDLHARGRRTALRATLTHIKDADHFYIERRDLLPKAVAAVTGWLDRRGF